MDQIMDEQIQEPAEGAGAADDFEQGPNRLISDEEKDVPVEDAAEQPSQDQESPEGSPADESASDEAAEEQDISAAVEAVLFATDTPLTAAKIAQVTKAATQRAVKEVIAALNAKYEQMACAFRIEGIAGGYQMLTQPQFSEVLGRLLRVRSETKLSAAALETLSIVAYRQPILRADIESIRGVASGEMLRSLMDRQLVKIVGRAEVLGRPMLYGTTRRFLEIFGLASLEDLPRVEELSGGNKPTAQTTAATASEPSSVTAEPAGIQLPSASSDQPAQEPIEQPAQSQEEANPTAAVAEPPAQTPE